MSKFIILFKCCNLDSVNSSINPRAIVEITQLYSLDCGENGEQSIFLRRTHDKKITVQVRDMNEDNSNK
jgi:hypothetical protein